MSLLADVKAVLIDENWFQVYDNKQKFTEDYAASGLYWNYFLHVWKTVSSSPFANAIVLVDSSASTANLDSVTVTITDKTESDEAITLTLIADDSAVSLANTNVIFVQTEALTTNGIAVHKYGALLVPTSQTSTEITLVAEINGTTYTASSTITASGANVGDTVTLSK